ALLRGMAGPVITPERLRTLRALEVLERLPEARPALEAIAKVESSTFLTQEAQASVQRLGEKASRMGTNNDRPLPKPCQVPWEDNWKIICRNKTMIMSGLSSRSS